MKSSDSCLALPCFLFADLHLPSAPRECSRRRSHLPEGRAGGLERILLALAASSLTDGSVTRRDLMGSLPGLVTSSL